MIPNIYLSDEQILDLEEEVEDAVFSGLETLTKPHLIAKVAAENAVKVVVELVKDWETMDADAFDAKWGDSKDGDGFCLSLLEILKKLALDK